jgi:hypothetical protein
MLDKFFISQVGFSIITVGFCMYMIITNPEASNISIFLPIICNIIGVYTPNPSLYKTINSFTTKGNDEEHLPIINKQTYYEAV